MFSVAIPYGRGRQRALSLLTVIMLYAGGSRQYRWTLQKHRNTIFSAAAPRNRGMRKGFRPRRTLVEQFPPVYRLFSRHPALKESIACERLLGGTRSPTGSRRGTFALIFHLPCRFWLVGSSPPHFVSRRRKDMRSTTRFPARFFA